MEKEKTQAIAKQNEVIVELPLTAEENQELKEREKRIQKAKEQLENAAIVIAHELSEIRAKNLFRETHKSFREYIKDRFGFTREYGLNLAQIGDFLGVAGEALQLTDGENNSVSVNVSKNVANEMLRAINRLSKSLGLTNVEFNILKPVIHNSIRLMVDTAPKAKDGVTPVLTARIVSKFNEVLSDFVQTGIVEIEGKQMTLAEVKDKGLLNHLLCEKSFHTWQNKF